MHYRYRRGKILPCWLSLAGRVNKIIIKTIIIINVTGGGDPILHQLCSRLEGIWPLEGLWPGALSRNMPRY